VAGGNFAQVDGDYYAGYHKAGMNAGGIVYTKLHDHVAAGLEILYSQKGSNGNTTAVTPSGLVITSYGIDLNYAEVPVTINYYDDGRTFIGGGLSISWLGTSSEHITTAGGQTFDPSQYPFKKTDLNLVAGGSEHLYKGLYVNVRFQYSLLSIRDNIPQSFARAAQYNNLWVFRLMYLFM